MVHYLLTQYDVTLQNQQGVNLIEIGSCWYNRLTYEMSTTCLKQDGPNLPSKKYQQWTNSAFLVAISSPIPHLTYWSNTISINMPTKTTTEVRSILPKLRGWVVFKEDDKKLCHKKESISTLIRVIYTGMYNYGDANTIHFWTKAAVYQIAVTLIGSHNLLVTDGIWALD